MAHVRVSGHSSSAFTLVDKAQADDETPEPTEEPTEAPTEEPTPPPTPEPTEEPTPEPTQPPTPEPTEEPTPPPEQTPIPEPTEAPSPNAGSTSSSQYHSGNSSSNSSSENSGFSAGQSTPTPRPSPTATPTPNPWREINLTTVTLGETQKGPVRVIGGFAAARRDGKAALACVSFKNVGQEVATQVVFQFSLHNKDGQDVGTMLLDRRGTFSPGIDIMSYPNFAQWTSTFRRDYNDSCTRLDQAMAALPILTARYASYRIMRVEFADGSSWPPHSGAQ